MYISPPFQLEMVTLSFCMLADHVVCAMSTVSGIVLWATGNLSIFALIQVV